MRVCVSVRFCCVCVCNWNNRGIARGPRSVCSSSKCNFIATSHEPVRAIASTAVHCVRALHKKLHMCSSRFRATRATHISTYQTAICQNAYAIHAIDEVPTAISVKQTTIQYAQIIHKTQIQFTLNYTQLAMTHYVCGSNDALLL